MATKQQQAEQLEAIQYLRELFPPGSTASTVLRHVTRSGMGRTISVLAADADGIHDVSWAVARAAGFPFDRDRGGVKVGGCGMDMGFHLVYAMSRVLYPDGHSCTGQGADFRHSCPSNDHSNGDRDYTPHHHADGGYAVRQRWV